MEQDGIAVVKFGQQLIQLITKNIGYVGNFVSNFYQTEWL